MHKMKIRHKSIRPALMATSLIITSQLSAATALFDFRSTNGSGIDNADAMGSNFDPSSSGDTITIPSVDGSTTITTTVVNFIVPTIVDGAISSITNNNASTNISGQDALGINNLNFGNTPYENATGQGAESSDFNLGESLTLSFDQNIIFTEIELESIQPTDGFEVLIDGVSQLEAIGDDSFIDDLEGLVGLTIPAGTEVTFAATSGDLATSSFRIETFTVDIVVPEPSSLALIALSGLAMCSRRKRI